MGHRPTPRTLLSAEGVGRVLARCRTPQERRRETAGPRAAPRPRLPAPPPTPTGRERGPRLGDIDPRGMGRGDQPGRGTPPRQPWDTTDSRRRGFGRPAPGFFMPGAGNQHPSLPVIELPRGGRSGGSALRGTKGSGSPATAPAAPEGPRRAPGRLMFKRPSDRRSPGRNPGPQGAFEVSMINVSCNSH